MDPWSIARDRAPARKRTRLARDVARYPAIMTLNRKRASIVSSEDLLALVDSRRDPVRQYLRWALREDQPSMRMQHRPDVHEAADAAALFSQPWWGIVVFSCFGS